MVCVWNSFSSDRKPTLEGADHQAAFVWGVGNSSILKGKEVRHQTSNCIDAGDLNFAIASFSCLLLKQIGYSKKSDGNKHANWGLLIKGILNQTFRHIKLVNLEREEQLVAFTLLQCDTESRMWSDVTPFNCRIITNLTDRTS